MGKRMCNKCNIKHTAPTGAKCTREQDKDTTLQELAQTVRQLATDVAALKTVPQSPPASVVSTTSTAASVSEENQPSPQELQLLEPLHNRVNAYMAKTTPASEDNLNTGKVARNPRGVNARSVRVLILWPHQFIHRTGQSDAIYDTLTLPEYVAGTCAILQLPEIDEFERKFRTSHLQWLMTLARTYRWESLRHLYGAVLEDIQYGIRQWDTPIYDLKDSMLTVEDTVSFKRPSTATRVNNDPCRAWNFLTCSRNPCPYAHCCIACLKYHGLSAAHKARDCQKRAEFLSKNGGATVDPQMLQPIAFPPPRALPPPSH